MARMPSGSCICAIEDLIKGFTISHLEGFGVEFGIDAVVVTVLGDEEFGVVG